MTGEQKHRPLRDHIGIFGPVVLITLLGFVFAYQFVDPAPSNQITIATGQKDGAYYLFGHRYQEILAREHVQLEVLESAGSIDNIELLESGRTEIAFVQGGTAVPGKDSDLRSLGSLYFEPLWVFHRQETPLSRLDQLRGKRVAVGKKGSGTRALALELLEDNQIDASGADLLSIGGREAVEALTRGEIDAAFFVASPRSPVVRSLLETDGIRLMSFNSIAWG